MQDGSLKSILKEGNPIKTRFVDQKKWALNNLHKVDDVVIEIDIRQDEGFLDDYLVIGDSVECKYLENEVEYLIVGWISKIKAEIPQRITVQVHKMIKEEDARGSISYETFLGCVIKNDSNDKGIFSIAKNIAKHNVVFTSKDTINTSRKLLLEVLISSKIIFKTFITVTASDETYRGIKYTAKFIETDVLNKRILENYLSELEKKKSETSNKQGSFWERHSKINT